MVHLHVVVSDLVWHHPMLRQYMKNFLFAHLNSPKLSVVPKMGFRHIRDSLEGLGQSILLHVT